MNYDYICPKCNHTFEKQLPPEQRNQPCPKCGTQLSPVIHAVPNNFHPSRGR